MHYTQIKSFQDACKALNLDPAALPDFSMLPEKHRNAMLAHTKLVIIAEALNAGWQPDWNDADQWKYYPWFNMQDGFSYDDYRIWCAGSSAGSRLCFSSREIAKYAGETFTDLYREYFTYQ